MIFSTPALRRSLALLGTGSPPAGDTVFVGIVCVGATLAVARCWRLWQLSSRAGASPAPTTYFVVIHDG